MNPVAEEMMSYYGHAESLGSDTFEHYGTPRHSGRYPWGSGDDPYQRGIDFLGRYESLKKQGMSDRDIAKELYNQCGTIRRILIASINTAKENNK